MVYIRLLDDSSPFPTSQWECQIVLVLLSLGAVNQCVCDKNSVVFFSILLLGLIEDRDTQKVCAKGGSRHYHAPGHLDGWLDCEALTGCP